MSSNSVITYLLSLIGIIPIDQHQLQLQQQQLQQQQQQQQQQQLKQQQEYYHGRASSSSSSSSLSSSSSSADTEEKCQLISSSAFVVQEDQDEQVELQDWLGKLSKMALCQILSSTIADYPQVADGIYIRHYEKNYKIKKKKRKQAQVITPNIEIEKLRSMQAEARAIAHELDNLRPSEQFGRAGETTEALLQMVRSLHVHSDQSFMTLFGLIIIAQESLLAPSEVRQHIFYHAKFGRTLILEISNILKNFNHTSGSSDQYWSSFRETSWLSDLQEVCCRLARYDITWEYRKEYNEVAYMAERYHHHLRH
ncbi:hypothetical protein [Parasitella parasitica]|uniref:Uncharacterized protein n=1 Tax=Parasitella parasitica TaxID=35722 RepID=A0A0B7N9J0_9FUNG|nr:hypothetical protein [Parasitella parasitica]